MQELCLVGIGTGNPDHLTLQGLSTLREAGLVLIPRKGDDKSDLVDLRRGICHRVPVDASRIVEFDLPKRDTTRTYFEAVDLWHDSVAETWKAVAGSSDRVALLIWGDPSLYDSSLRIAQRLTPSPHITVVPGITALQALAAAFAIPLTGIGRPLAVTTGRRLRELGWPSDTETVAVMLDGNCAFTTLPREELFIWWGAYLGMKRELLISGYLAEVSDLIVETRAKVRAENGWIMDTYLLRKA